MARASRPATTLEAQERRFALTLLAPALAVLLLTTTAPLVYLAWNSLHRLDLGMPLQSDPTAVYGVRAFAGKVSKQDIMRKTPYNTYLIQGLPPGPIGNPGSDAIEAALAPASTGYLYFVAKKDGSHFFSATLEQHNRAVRKYLR